MKAAEALQKIPKAGFLKLTLDRAEMPPKTRSALIRKGNELLNQGKHDLALRIFLTAGYADGLVRLGEVYEKQGNAIEAFRMYWLAKYRKKIDPTVEKMAGVLRRWLGEPDGAGEPPGDRRM
jgi:hypothetical protein